MLAYRQPKQGAGGGRGNAGLGQVDPPNVNPLSTMRVPDQQRGGRFESQAGQECPDLLSSAHCHDGDELCHIVSGTMKFVSGFDSHLILEAGEGVVIEKNRLHGAIIESEECVYQIYSVGDYTACLS